MKTKQVVSKLIDLMSDSRIKLSDWKYDIPTELVQQDLPILANAKNLADGINYALDRHGIDLPEDIVIAYAEDEQVIVNGKVRNGL